MPQAGRSGGHSHGNISVQPPVLTSLGFFGGGAKLMRCQIQPGLSDSATPEMVNWMGVLASTSPSLSSTSSWTPPTKKTTSCYMVSSTDKSLGARSADMKVTWNGHVGGEG